MDRKEKVL